MYGGYYYPFYRAFPTPYWPGVGYPYQSYYGSYINAYQSQLANQSVINTGVATNISQVFSPTAIY